MGINVSYLSIDTLFRKTTLIMRNCIVTALAKLGEECIARIRDRSKDESWEDHTGNLRSSIGYAVYAQGAETIRSAFQQVMQGVKGSEAGKRMIDELATRYSKTYSLTVIAGMDYASYVQAIKGKDVLASTELWAKQVVGQRLQRALESAAEQISRL